jgi:hypothetical protein
MASAPRTNGAFPYYWWESDEVEGIVYDGAFPIIGKPPTRWPTTGPHGHRFKVFFNARRYVPLSPRDRKKMSEIVNI